MIMAQPGTRTSGSDSDAVDVSLAALFDEPFHIQRPFRQTVPFVLASPHSGRDYPESFVGMSRLGRISLRRSEDAFVDELFGGAVALGAPMISARFPRAYLDANRAPSEIDSAMFDGRLPVTVDSPSPRVTAGLGVIPRIVRDGAEIYRAKLSPREAELRLTRLYRPYHAALAQLVAETLEIFGVAVVIDCHRMSFLAIATAWRPHRLSPAPRKSPWRTRVSRTRATRLMPAATPPSCMAGATAMCMRCRSKSTAGSISTKSGSSAARVTRKSSTA
jgi:hypothetical protein